MNAFNTKQWWLVPGYQNSITGIRYEVSPSGQCRSVRTLKSGQTKVKMLRPQRRGRYLGYTLSTDEGPKQISAHRLVALALLDASLSSEALVCHWDDDPDNNHVSNLYVGTSRTNAQDRRFNSGEFELQCSPGGISNQMDDIIAAYAFVTKRSEQEILDLALSKEICLFENCPFTQVGVIRVVKERGSIS